LFEVDADVLDHVGDADLDRLTTPRVAGVRYSGVSGAHNRVSGRVGRWDEDT
jgi:hypothetical protein